MEPLMIFAIIVGFIGVFHLLATTVTFFGKGRHYRDNQEDKTEDWYCFFKPSDLLGKNKAKQLAQRRLQQATHPHFQS